MDLQQWKRILCSNNFGGTNLDLRKAIANFIKNIRTEKVSAVSIEAFAACRLIPLDKNPGLRPVGVGEILRRITGKVTVSVLKKEAVLQLSHSKYVQGKRLDPRQLYTLWKNFSKRNQQRQFY